jgi:hypothetical protein
MNEFEQLWNETEAVSDEGGFETIDEGTYICKISDTNFDMTKHPNRAVLTLDIVTNDDRTESKFKGRKVWANYQMSPQGIGFFKRDLARLGVDHSGIKGLEDLSTTLGLLVDKHVEVYVKNKPSTKNPSKMFTTPYINSAVDMDMGF